MTFRDVSFSSLAAIVENGSKLTWYRRADRPAYGRAASLIRADANAALAHEPEHSLGQFYNNNLFHLGHVPEIPHLNDAILDGKPLARGTIERSAGRSSGRCHGDENG